MTAPFSLALFRMNAALTKKAFADITEEQMRAQPGPGMNPPIWILGHLCFAWDGVLRLIGQRSICSADFKRPFVPGSKLDGLPAELPSKTEMLAKFDEISERLLAELPKVDEAQWAKPNPSPFFTTELPTVLDMVSNLLFSHHMMHVGQLTVWRRLMGLGSVMQI
jgi:uncharacterized damage-inducible protein DinB